MQEFAVGEQPPGCCCSVFSDEAWLFVKVPWTVPPTFHNMPRAVVQFYAFKEEVKLFIALYPYFEGQFKVNIIIIRGSNLNLIFPLSQVCDFCVFSFPQNGPTLCSPNNTSVLLFMHVINTLIHPFRQQQKLKFIPFTSQAFWPLMLMFIATFYSFFFFLNLFIGDEHNREAGAMSFGFCACSEYINMN